MPSISSKNQYLTTKFTTLLLIISTSTTSYSISPTCNYQGYKIILSFPKFNTTNCNHNGGLLCMGRVTPSDEGYLNLTTASSNGSSTEDFMSIARVLYHNPIEIWPTSFCTSFSFIIFPRLDETWTGDGMAFVMATDDKSSPNKSFGSYLGLQDPLLAGNTDFQQLAIEMDTFKNEWDPDGNHIGIDTTSVMHSLITKSLNSSNIDLKGGRQIRVKIEYNGYTKNLQIFVGYEGNPLASFLNYTIKVSKKLPRQSYIGFTAATGTLTETHQIHDWIFTSKVLPEYTVRNTNKRAIVLAIDLPIVCGIILLAVIMVPIYRKRMIKKRERIRRMEEIERQYAAAAPKKFTYKQLAKATKNFSKVNLLGTGGFGSVYKGHISDPPQTVAVKKISATSQQGEREYVAEICTIGRLRHKNILQLQGWSHEEESLLLVYDYMANKSLNEFLSGKTFLDWETRYKIITGLASALLYLHEECGDPVVHRDVKPSNVMLDAEFNPRLGDFGLARLLKNAQGVTTMVAGTLGYMAPEVSYRGKATTESDVYSFGVVALEVVCGKRFSNLLGESCLADYAWDLHSKGRIVECVDPKLGGKFEEDQAVRVLRVALACLHLDLNLRPPMRKVLNILMNSDEPLIDLPDVRPKGVYVSVYGFSNQLSGTNVDPGNPLLTLPDYPSGSSTTTSNFPDDSLLVGR